ncbi:hypothetical protein GDO86_020533 [Hymenochirus boettgeri]|uniref:Uncharacterized protein n=1 Tax=Hymenochirus boettgeri TaxID=247094 RepID=A0A8T2II87_9PIPI|nr:hypothetical protein GDO86_020533 [Hymenochirus boettgeri]
MSIRSRNEYLPSLPPKALSGQALGSSCRRIFMPVFSAPFLKGSSLLLKMKELAHAQRSWFGQLQSFVCCDILHDHDALLLSGRG